MKKEFIKYEQALALKELGFDEPCLFAWCNYGGWNKYKGVREPIMQRLQTDGNPFGNFYNGKNWNKGFAPNPKNKIQCSAPLKQQVFKFFREKYQVQGYIYSTTVRGNKDGKTFSDYCWNINGIDLPFISTDRRDMEKVTYEEAESACLDKLIEICKTKTNEQVN